MMSAHSTSSALSGVLASLSRPAEATSTLGQDENTSSAVGLRSRFWLQTKRRRFIQCHLLLVKRAAARGAREPGDAPGIMLTFQRFAIPLRQVGCGFVGRLQKIEKHYIRGFRLPDHIVGQNELPKIGTIERGLWLDRRRREAGWFRIGVRIESGVGNHASTRPKPATTHLVRVGLSRHPVRQVRNPAGVFRRSSPRKTGDSEVGSAPEEMHRAAFADEASAKSV